MLFLLKKAWQDVSEQCIINCFRKADISKESQEDVINEADNPFADIFVDGDDDGSFEDLEINLNQLRDLDANLAPEEINAATLIDVDANISTDTSKPLTVEEIIAEISGEGDQVIDDESEEVEDILHALQEII